MSLWRRLSIIFFLVRSSRFWDNISGCSTVGSMRHLGCRGRRFESCHPDHYMESITTVMRLTLLSCVDWFESNPFHQAERPYIYCHLGGCIPQWDRYSDQKASNCLVRAPDTSPVEEEKVSKDSSMTACLRQNIRAYGMEWGLNVRWKSAMLVMDAARNSDCW